LFHGAILVKVHGHSLAFESEKIKRTKILRKSFLET